MSSYATSMRPRRSTCASTRCERARCSTACPAASRMPFRWTINPYRGCGHACVYCFARPTHTYLGFDAGRDFEREIVVKVNAPEVLRAELARPSWAREHVALGTNTDPYQWVEGRYRLMVGIWEALRDAANPCSVLTKSPLLLRDLDADARGRGSGPRVQREPVDPDARRARLARDRAAHPAPRARGSRRSPSSTVRGSAPGVLIAPLMPGVNDAPRAGGAAARGGARGRRDERSAASRCICAARCATSSWAGCAKPVRSWSGVTKRSTVAGPTPLRRSASASPPSPAAAHVARVYSPRVSARHHEARRSSPPSSRRSAATSPLTAFGFVLLHR